MKIFLMFSLGALILMTPQEKSGEQTSAALIVLKFTCGIYEARSSMIRSVQEPDPPNNEPTRINQSVRNEPQEIINRRDMQERRAELKIAEINAARSNQPDSRIYFYNLEVKNTGNKVMKSFAWAYQVADTPSPSDRQFYCVVRTKPNQNKEFELFSPLAPFRVVDVSKTDHKREENLKEKVVINKIEYMDGSVWQRADWDARTFSPEATLKVEIGKCIGL